MRVLALAAAAAALLLAPCAAWGQAEPDTTTTEGVETDVERGLDDLGTEAGDGEQLAELLTALAADPLDLNTASADAFALIPAFTPVVARRIVAYRTANGLFASLPEVRAVPGVTGEVFLRARPYLRLGDDDAEGRARRYPRFPRLATVARGLQLDMIQRATRRLDLGRGFDDDTTRTTFEGGPVQLYTRLQASYRRRLSLNLTLDKDAGEPFRWDPTRQTFGYDHVAGHLALRDLGRVRMLVVGDFTAEFGQGLTFWRALAFGKGRDPIGSLARSGRGLVAFSSTEENRFFRGAGATVRLTPRLSVTAFASRRRLDATLTEADTTTADVPAGALVASTLSSSGLHRTAAERVRRDALREDLAGGAVEYATDRVLVGATGYASRFDRAVAPRPQPYARFDFAGDRAAMGSAYANVFLGDYLLFGEVARAPGGAVGAVGGALADFGPAEALLLARTYPRAFTSLHGFGFGERNGATQNEQGVYAGLRLRLSRTVRVGGYVDQYRFPWLRFGVPRPSSGLDARLVVEHDPRPWLGYYVQLQSETREAGADVPGPTGPLLDAVQPETRQSLRVHGDYSFSRDLRLRARIEATRFQEAGTPAAWGVLLYQDVRYHPPVRGLRLDARLAFFDTDGFDTRVYAYENDLLYAFSVPAFFGRGQRAYLLARYEVMDGLILEAKYAVSRFQGVDTIGSGLNEIDGNRLREVRAQVRWRLR